MAAGVQEQLVRGELAVLLELFEDHFESHRVVFEDVFGDVVQIHEVELILGMQRGRVVVIAVEGDLRAVLVRVVREVPENGFDVLELDQVVPPEHVLQIFHAAERFRIDDQDVPEVGGQHDGAAVDAVVDLEAEDLWSVYLGLGRTCRRAETGRARGSCTR